MKTFLKHLFYKSLVTNLILRYNQCPRVFCYHGIDELLDTDVEAESIHVESFTKQIDYLNKNFNLISIEEFDYRFKTHALGKMDATITFDDGYENMYSVVDPIMRKRGIPYTVFLSTDNITTGNLFSTTINRLITRTGITKRVRIPFLNIDESIVGRDNFMKVSERISRELKNRPYEEVCIIAEQLKRNMSENQFQILIDKYKSVKLMNWNQVVELSNKGGVTFGAHTCHHICCHNNQNIELVKKELMDCKQLIEEMTSKDCKYFAYPNGMFTNSSNDIVRDMFSLGFSTRREERITYSTDRACIPRISATHSLEYFKYIIAKMPLK